MKKLLLGLVLAASMLPVQAKPITSEPIEESDYNTPHAMGCMLLRECTDGVIKINSIEDLEKYYGVEYNIDPTEFNALVKASEDAGVGVYLAPEKYFLKNNRGVYHTVGNNFFLNDFYMHKSHHLMSVMRHEGWHAAQDCMAGSLHNTVIAIIHNTEDVPKIWKNMAEDLYPESIVPWEAEALWAGRVEGMTLEALKVCASDQKMWEVYTPTPLTRQYLVDQGYIKE